MGNYLTGVVLLAAGTCGLVGCAVLLAVGLVRRRRVFWGAAAVGMVVALMLGATGGVCCALQAWRDAKSSVKHATQGALSGLGEQLREGWTGNDDNARKWFEWGTGVKLPVEAKYLAGRDYSGWLSVVWVKIHVPLEFEAVLDQKIGRAARPIDMSPPNYVTKEMPEWPEAVAAPGMLYYSAETGDANEGGFTARICFDPKSGMMYCRIVEYSP
jgi:hypothetical protein